MGVGYNYDKNDSKLVPVLNFTLGNWKKVTLNDC